MLPVPAKEMIYEGSHMLDEPESCQEGAVREYLVLGEPVCFREGLAHLKADIVVQCTNMATNDPFPPSTLHVSLRPSIGEAQ